MGMDILGSAGADEIGFDLEGDYALFSRGISPIILIRLSDRDAFSDAISMMREMNPDLDWDRQEIGGTNFHSAIVPGDIRVLLGVRGSYAVIRMGLDEDNWRTAEDDLVDLFYGYGDVGGLWDSPIVTELAERGDGREPAEVGYVTMEALNDLIGFATRSLNDRGISFGLAGLSLSDGGYESDEHRDMCELGEERMLTNYSWLGYVEFDDPSGEGLNDSNFVVDMSPAHSERVQEMLNAAVAGVLTDVEDAALYVAVHADLEALIDSVRSEPETVSCPSIAAPSGLLASLNDRFGPTIEYNLEFINGNFAVAVYSAEMRGFLPFIDAALMIGSPDPERLTEYFTNQIDANGGSATVDTTASVHTINFRLLHLRLQLLQLDDRIVLTIGDVPDTAIEALAFGEIGGTEAPFSEVHWNGESMRAIIDMATEYLDRTGSYSEDEMGSIYQQVENMRAIDELHVVGEWDDSSLVLSVESATDASQVRQREGTGDDDDDRLAPPLDYSDRDDEDADDGDVAPDSDDPTE